MKQVKSIIQIEGPINIIDVTEKGFDFGLWISVLIAFISTCVLIWNEIKESEVYGKVISKTYSQTGTLSFKTKNNEEKVIKGQQYILKLSLSCLQKSLNYKDVNVFVTYGNEKIAGEIYWTKYSNLNFQNSDGNTSEKQMLTPANDFLTFNNVLEQGKTSFYYLNFMVPNKSGAVLYDKLELEFVKPNGKKINVQIFEIDAKQYFFDDTLIKN